MAPTALDRLLSDFSTCVKFWLAVYAASCCFVSVFMTPMVNFTAIGLLLCLLSYFRLAAPDPADVHRVLGHDPRNFDGSPSRSVSRGVLGLVARRCASLDAPENTIEAVKKVKKSGGTSVHMDMSFTSDGVALALRPSQLHDFVVDSSKTLDPKNQVSDISSVEASSLDVARDHALRDAFATPMHPVTVERLVDTCLEEDMRIIIEVSVHVLDGSSVADYILNTLLKERMKLKTMCVIVSPWPHVVYAIRRCDPAIVCGLTLHHRAPSSVIPCSWRPFVGRLPDTLLRLACDNFMWDLAGVSVVVVHRDDVTPALANRWRSRGVRLVATPVNNSLQRLYLERHLRVTCMSDTMDEIGIDKLIKDDL